MPSGDPNEPCPRRWGIEIGYKMVKQTRIHTSSRDERVRIFCFVLSLLAHNAWTMMHSDRRAARDHRHMPAVTLKLVILPEVCSMFGATPRPGPPGKAQPQAAPGSPHLGSVCQAPRLRSVLPAPGGLSHVSQVAGILAPYGSHDVF